MTGRGTGDEKVEVNIAMEGGQLILTYVPEHGDQTSAKLFRRSHQTGIKDVISKPTIDVNNGNGIQLIIDLRPHSLFSRNKPPAVSVRPTDDGHAFVISTNDESTMRKLKQYLIGLGEFDKDDKGKLIVKKEHDFSEWKVMMEPKRYADSSNKRAYESQKETNPSGHT